MYLMAGAGAVLLDSGDRATMTSFGGGAGLWFTQHLMSRLEVRYQTYKDRVYVSDPQINQMALHLSLGFLL
jgi:hypothetical protein